MEVKQRLWVVTRDLIANQSIKFSQGMVMKNVIQPNNQIYPTTLFKVGSHLIVSHP